VPEYSDVSELESGATIPVSIVVNGSSVRIERKQVCIVSEQSVEVFAKEIPAKAYETEESLEAAIGAIIGKGSAE